MFNFYFARRVFNTPIETLDPPRMQKLDDTSFLNYHEGPYFSAYLDREQTLKAALTEDNWRKPMIQR